MLSIDDRMNAIIRELIGNGISLEQAVEAFEGKYILAAMTAARAKSPRANVFISHSASETEFANALRTALTQQDVDVWSPESELLPGDNWLLQAGRALERANAVVFLLSADSINSAAANREIQYAIAHPKFEHRVFPVLVGRNVSKIPWVLRDLVITGNVDSVAREIAARLQAKASAKTRRPATFKRRVRSTGTASSVASKNATKREPKRARRAGPAG
jgi:hypothetical protein